MKIHSVNQDGIIDILYDGSATFLKIQNIIAVDCFDNGGTITRYYSLTAENHEHLVDDLNDALINGCDEVILSQMEQFIQLFSQGEYFVIIKRNNYKSQIHFDFNKSIDSISDIYSYYNPTEDNFVFTQYVDKLDRDRVEYYKNLIKQGCRPKAIVFSSYFEENGIYDNGETWQSSHNSPLFILDGHHKMLAYHETEISPEFIHISKNEINKSPNLLFNYYNKIANKYLRTHIFASIPAMFQYDLIEKLQDSEDWLLYNREIDFFLNSTICINPCFTKLCIDILNTDRSTLIEWLHQKIEVLCSRDLSGGLRVYYFENGYYQYMTIENKQDIGYWFSKIRSQVKN